MSEYALTQVSMSDRGMLAQVDALLLEEGIIRDATLDYFQSPEAEPVLQRLRSADNVIHY